MKSPAKSPVTPSFVQLIAALERAVAARPGLQTFAVSATDLWRCGGPEPAHAGRIGRQQLDTLREALAADHLRGFTVTAYEPRRGGFVVERTAA